MILLILFYFFILVLPTIRARQTEINATAEVGNSAMLACDADGFPEPMVTWIQYVVSQSFKSIPMSLFYLVFVILPFIVVDFDQAYLITADKCLLFAAKTLTYLEGESLRGRC